jgi:hypothetical protein
MHEFAWTYWWLIFPIMWFVFGIVGMAFRHQRDRHALELMKTYAEKGKDPGDIAKALGDGPSYWESRWDRRWARRAWRYTPYGAWQRAIMSICVAGAFWFAAYYFEWPFYGPGLTVVAIIMSVIAAGAVLTAIFASLFAPRRQEL